MESRAFRWRALIAFLVTWAFAVATVTGIVLYVVPQGRVAYWTDWRMLGLGKDDWAGVHMVFGGIFIVTGAIHLWFNWKPFMGYLSERLAGQVRMRREAVVSLVVAALVLAGAVARVPPVSWVFDLNAEVKAIWAGEEGAEPPFGHAEELSLAGFAKRQGMDADSALAALRSKGWAVVDRRQSLAAIAGANGVNPAALYRVLRPLEPAAEPIPSEGLTAEAVEARFGGSGLGRKTLAQVCAEAGIDPVVARARLEAAGLSMGGEETFREAADSRGVKPMDLLKIIAVEGRRP